MSDFLENKGSLYAILIAIFVIFISGLFFGVSYYVMDTVQTQLETVECDIPNNLYFDDCQGMFALSIYPMLGLKSIFVWFSYIFIFALVLGILVLGYKSGKSPMMVGFLFVITLVFTYLGIEVSNIYRNMLTNDIIYSMLTPFPIYNKIMLNFPWFIGFVGLLSMALSIVNFQRSKVNAGSTELDY